MKYYIKRTKRRLITGIFLVALAGLGLGGCGAGGDDADEGIIGTGYLLKGTVASERMLAQSSVEVKAASGERTIASIGNDGRFESDDIEGDSPYLMRVDLGNNNYQYSIGHLSNGAITQNMHSYTDAAARNWFAVNGLNIDSQFDSGSALSAMPSADQYAGVFDSLLNIVSLVQADYGLDNVDLSTVSFNADDTGVDAFLNQNPVLINNGQITIIINDSGSDTQSIATSNLSVSTDLQLADTTAPGTPGSVRVLQAAADEVVVVWESATDNIGVAGYQVLRDGALVDTTPYPVFIDSGLSSGVAYSYSIIAVDADGNESSATNLQMITLTATVDDTAPPAPVALQANATSTSVEVDWQQADINDVALFEVQRTTADNTPVTLATVTSTFFTDPAVESGTQYCYQVVAIDSSGNRSELSTNQCATTAGNAIVTPLPVDTGVELGFASSSYSVSESGGSVTVSVSRTGTAAASVDYSVVGGTASSGEDFAASSGTLIWPAGDTGGKTITVQISADNAVENSETFSVMLSNAGGDGVIVNSEATVTINDVASVSCDIEISTTRIEEDTTISAGCYLVNADLVVNEGANLTLAPGTILKFSAGSELRVNTGASFTSEGTAGAPILLTAQDQTPGYWDGVDFRYSNSTRNSLSYTTVEYGGGGNSGANLLVTSLSSISSRVSITNSTFRHGQGFGVAITEYGVQAAFDNNTLTLNDRPISIAPEFVSALSANSTFTGNVEDLIEINDSSVESAASWAKLDAPYSAGDLSLDAALTIAAGVRMEFEASSQLRVGGDGALIAVGTEAEPIVFTSPEQTTGFWDGLRFVYSTSPQNKLEHVIIEYGGSTANNDALLSVSSLSSIPSRLTVNHVTLRNSLGDGFNIAEYSILSQFDNITSTSNGRPGVIAADLVSSLGSGLSLTGNQNDIIFVEDGSIEANGTWADHGVPYSAGDVRVNVSLTLEPGVQMLMRTGSLIRVDSDGTLAARGTAEQPVDIRGEQEIAGYWIGIDYAYSNSTSNILDHVVISHGGGGSPSTAANVELTCLSSIPTRLSISNTSLNSSSGWGILSGPNCLLDLGVGVTYSNNATGDLSP